jgi:2-dehydro-3-deoxyphosphogluconate aldolase / (4S)-4-hydroxy-2-oxoglutarate aldolase
MNMARYNKVQVISTALQTGLIPVFYNADLETSKAVLKACHDGGISMFEFTNRGDFAHETFAGLVKYANENLPGMILGAGSVIDAPTAALYIQAGANFIVGPLFNRRCQAGRGEHPWMVQGRGVMRGHGQQPVP